MDIKNSLLGLVAALIGTVIALVLAESLLRLFWKEGSNYYLWPPGYQAETTPRVDLMPGLEAHARLQVNSNGIRGSEWSGNRENEYRIITIGGSTTESLYLDQSDNWSSLLEKNLDNLVDGHSVWVGNLGRAGFNSRDHVAFMQHVLDQYDVDAVVMLVGGNDMIHRLMQGENYEPFFIEDKPRYYKWLKNRFVSVPVTSQLSESKSYKRTFIFQFLRSFYHGHTDKRNIVRDMSGDWIEKARENRKNAKKTDALIDLQSGLTEYENNIRTIISEAKNRSIDIVLLTQPTIWKHDMTGKESESLWWGSTPNGEFYTTGALSLAMDEYNKRLLDVCSNLDTDCIDMAAKIPKTSDIFYDDIHNTKYGAEYFADILTEELRSNKLLVFSD